MVILKNLILLIGVFFLSSCSSWRMVDKNSFHPGESTRSIRVNLVNGEIFKAKNYYVKSDTLVIITPKTFFYQAEDRLIPLKQIKKIEIFDSNSDSRVFWGVITAGGIVLFIIINEAMTEFGNAIEAVGH